MSILRAGLLVVGIVLGSVIIAYGFPAAGSAPPGAHAVTSPSARPSHHARPTPTSSTTPTAQPLACGSPQGVKIAVENAAGATGLAAATATRLKAAGYAFNTTSDISDALSQSSTTT